MEPKVPKYDFSVIQNVLKPVFGSISESQWDSIKDLVSWKFVKGGEKIISQGATSDCIYFLVSGRLSAVLEGEDGQMTKLGEVAAGQSVGELGVFTKEKRSSSVFAIRDSVLIQLDELGLKKFLSLFPNLVFGIMQTIVRRSTQQLGKDNSSAPGRVISLLVEKSGSLTKTFLSEIKTEIQKSGTCKTIDASTFYNVTGVTPKDLNGDDPLVNARVQQFFDQAESDHDFVFIISTPDEPAFFEQSTRQADMYFVIKSFSDNPTPTVLEKKLYTGHHQLQTTHLVLLHADGKTKPENTARFLTDRNVHLHHHVRMDRKCDMARVVRYISGNAVGIALAGGGAKGMAHVGVYLALKDKGVPMDYICGTSAGSIAGAFFAMDLEEDEVMRSANRIAKFIPTKRKNMNFFPFISLLKGKDLDKFLHELYGDINIEDLWINFSCMSANLSEKTAREISHGRLDKATRASISLPGLFPPAVDGNNLLLDGGILDNLPISTLEKKNINRKIIVTLHKFKSYKLDYDRVPDSVEHIKNKVTGRRIKVPKFASIIMEAMVLSNYDKYKEAIQRCDLHIEPPVQQVGFLAWDRHLETIEQSRKYTDKKLSETPIDWSSPQKNKRPTV
ncbi:MAG: patatin-like phospholipase family protein [Cryomorphaceae bacterium]|nr:patatin-like phospholipase family protein [Cryomorphaceae bacterium]